MLLIAYYRVSTRGQMVSGLGLDAQKAAVEHYRQSVKGTIMAEYEEQESGKRSDRPQLSYALAHAKRIKATLVIARLDRLSRNVAFLSALLEAGVPFVCTDIPEANKLTLHILAAVAQNEAEITSQRTKAALAQAKARGVLLGSARPGHWAGKEHLRVAACAKARIEAVKSVKRKAREAYADILPMMQRMRSEQFTFQEIAERLNKDGHTTRRGKPWSSQQVWIVLKKQSA